MKTDDLAQLLRDARQDAKLSHLEVAEAIHVSERAVVRWEQADGLSTVADYLSALEACGIRITRARRRCQICHPDR